MVAERCFLSLLKDGYVLTGAKNLPCSSEYDAPHLGIAFGLLESGLGCRYQLEIEGIDLRSVEGDGQYSIIVVSEQDFRI